MRLLFDQNLSPKLVQRLRDVYPNASHVSLSGLDRASDEAVWSYARTHDYVIVTKDSDFSDAAVLRGVPPKVVWLRLGNCTTADVEQALRHAQRVLEDLQADAGLGVLEIL
jgi:predicted nuclease of predicted toxin-antitoxin system